MSDPNRDTGTRAQQAASRRAFTLGALASLAGASAIRSASAQTQTPFRQLVPPRGPRHPKGEVHVRDFGAVGDGVTDDTAALQAAVAALEDGNALIFAPGDRYLVAGSSIIDIRANDVTVIGFGAELWSENSDDPETQGPAFFPQLWFSGANARLLGLSWRGGIFTVNTKRFSAFGGRSYHLHNAGFSILWNVGMEFLKIQDWEFDTSLDTDPGNYTAIQCGAVAANPKNDLAVIQDCTFRGTAGGVNLHNFDKVEIVRMRAAGIPVNHVKTDEGARSIAISGWFDGAPIDPASANRHLSTPSSYMAFLASNQLREVTLDVELENFQGANGVYFVNTTSPIVTRGRLAARNCSVGIFDRCPGHLDLVVDLEDCTGAAVNLANPVGVWALRQTVTGRLKNSRMTIGNSSTTTLEEKRIEVRVVADHNVPDPVLQAVDVSPSPGWEIDEVLVQDSHFKVAGGTAVAGAAGNFRFTLGKNNTYEGAATNFTGQREGEFRTNFGGGTLPSVKHGELNLRHTAAGGANYSFDDGKAAPGDRVRIVNDGGGDVALFLLTLDGFSTTNRVHPGATIDIVKVASGTNEWRTLGSYGSVTQA